VSGNIEPSGSRTEPERSVDEDSAGKLANGPLLQNVGQSQCATANSTSGSTRPARNGMTSSEIVMARGRQ
jgi:hypothetical protein